MNDAKPNDQHIDAVKKIIGDIRFEFVSEREFRILMDAVYALIRFPSTNDEIAQAGYRNLVCYPIIPPYPKTGFPRLFVQRPKETEKDYA